MIKQMPAPPTFFSYLFIVLNDVLQNLKKNVSLQMENFSTNISHKLNISPISGTTETKPYFVNSDTSVLQKRKLIRIWYSFQIYLKTKV